MFRRAIFVVAAVVSIAPDRVSAQTPTTFNYSFTGATTGAPDGSATAGNITAGNFTIGNANGTVAAPINSTSASSGYTGASAGNNIGNAVKTGALNVSTSSYFSVILTPDAGYTLTLNSISFGVRSTSTGAQSYSLRTSANGDAFGTELAGGTIANNSAYSLKSNTLVTPVDLGSGAIELRLYAAGVVGSPSANTITTRLDDIAINVTANPVPEPATVLALAAGGLGLGGFVRRRLRGGRMTVAG